MISGRPVAFLADRLPAVIGSSVDLFGLYGLESAGPDGQAVSDPALEPWRSVVRGAVEQLRVGAPDGVLVEPKGTTVTVHWRQAPEAESWVVAAVAGVAAETGLVPRPARLSLELHPPVPIDKGTIVSERLEGMTAACYLGDDVGDLPAFDALGRWAAIGGTVGVLVAVEDAETAPEVLAAADVVVAGPEHVMGILRWLASELGLAIDGAIDGAG